MYSYRYSTCLSECTASLGDYSAIDWHIFVNMLNVELLSILK